MTQNKTNHTVKLRLCKAFIEISFYSKYSYTINDYHIILPSVRRNIFYFLTSYRCKYLFKIFIYLFIYLFNFSPVHPSENEKFKRHYNLDKFVLFNWMNRILLKRFSMKNSRHLRESPSFKEQEHPYSLLVSSNSIY